MKSITDWCIFQAPPNKTKSASKASLPSWGKNSSASATGTKVGCGRWEGTQVVHPTMCLSLYLRLESYGCWTCQSSQCKVKMVFWPAGGMLTCCTRVSSKQTRPYRLYQYTTVKPSGRSSRMITALRSPIQENTWIMNQHVDCVLLTGRCCGMLSTMIDPTFDIGSMVHGSMSCWDECCGIWRLFWWCWIAKPVPRTFALLFGLVKETYDGPTKTKHVSQTCATVNNLTISKLKPSEPLINIGVFNVSVLVHWVDPFDLGHQSIGTSHGVQKRMLLWASRVGRLGHQGQPRRQATRHQIVNARHPSACMYYSTLLSVSLSLCLSLSVSPSLSASLHIVSSDWQRHSGKIKLDNMRYASNTKITRKQRKRLWGAGKSALWHTFLSWTRACMWPL